jgi:FkbM family methyltransferase
MTIIHPPYHLYCKEAIQRLLFFSVFLFRFAACFQPELAPRNIYIDVGANDGSSVRTFVDEMLSITGTNKDRNGFQASEAYSSPEHNRSIPWIVHAFEPNPRFEKQLHEICGELQASKKIASCRLHVGTAMFIKDGNMTFYSDQDNGMSGDLGASLKSTSRSINPSHASYSVHVVDVVSFFTRLHIRRSDFVVLKLDVEGAEFEIVRRILLHGLMDYIDKIAVEWHHTNFWVFGAGGDDSPERKKITEEYTKMYEHLKWMIEGDEEIKSKFVSWG